jgi:hypothetical protein
MVKIGQLDNWTIGQMPFSRIATNATKTTNDKRQMPFSGVLDNVVSAQGREWCFFLSQQKKNKWRE